MNEFGFFNGNDLPEELKRALFEALIGDFPTNPDDVALKKAMKAAEDGLRAADAAAKAANDPNILWDYLRNRVDPVLLGKVMFDTCQAVNEVVDRLIIISKGFRILSVNSVNPEDLFKSWAEQMVRQANAFDELLSPRINKRTDEHYAEWDDTTGTVKQQSPAAATPTANGMPVSVPTPPTSDNEVADRILMQVFQGFGDESND